MCVGRGGRSEDTDEDAELLGEASEEDGEDGDDDKGEADGGGAGPRGPDDAGGDAVADRAAAQQRYETELARLREMEDLFRREVYKTKTALYGQPSIA